MHITRWSGIHATDKFICVDTLSGYAQTLREEDIPTVYLEPDVADVVLGRAVLEALDKSRFIPGVDRDFYNIDRINQNDKRWHAEMMKRFRYRTKRETYATMRYCIVQRYLTTIRIQPHGRHEKPGDIVDLPKDQDVRLAATTDPLIMGAAVKLALSRCR